MVEPDEIEDRCLDLVPGLPNIVMRLVTLASHWKLGFGRNLLQVKNLFVEMNTELDRSEQH